MSKAIMLFAGTNATAKFNMLNDHKIIKNYSSDAINSELINLDELLLDEFILDDTEYKLFLMTC